MKQVFCFAMALLVLASSGAGTALAEDSYNDAANLVRERKSAESTEQTARAAAKKKEREELKDITFEAVLESPDDVETNLRFAQEKIAKNELLPASAALERILLVRPGLARVRLLYAVVLYRLDNLTESEIQFKKILALNPPGGIRDEIGIYMKKIKSRRRSYRFIFRQSNGFQYDDNRNAAPSSKQRLSNDVRVDLPPTSGRNGDTSFINATGLEYHQDLGFQAGHEFYSKFDYFLAEQTEVDNLDIQAFQSESGFNLKSRIVDLQPSITMTHVGLSRETFLRSLGGGLRLEREVRRGIKVYTEGRLTRQNYSGVNESPNAEERDGRQMEGSTGIRYAFLPTMSVTAEYTYTDKNAEREFNAYEGNGFGLGHQWLLGKGQFLATNLQFDRNLYEAPELTISGRKRRDNLFRTRVTYGLPLETLFFKKVPLGPLRDLLCTVSYEYFRSRSNITNYTYRNNKVQMMLTKVIEF